LINQREITQTVRGINKLNDAIDWELFRPELESLLVYDNRDLSKGGRPPFNPALMLQKYHNLSDEQTEFQIGDRLSLMQFLRLQVSAFQTRRPFGILRGSWTRTVVMAHASYSSALLYSSVVKE
jgi:hypothetical protein